MRQKTVNNAPAMRKRYATDHATGTVPSWPLMTSHVDPQISVTTPNSIAVTRLTGRVLLFPVNALAYGADGGC